MKYKLTALILCVLVLCVSCLESAASPFSKLDIIRLHIISTDQSTEAQQQKYRVRDAIQLWLSNQEIAALSVDEAYRYLAGSMAHIKDIANDTLATNGYSYKAKVFLAKDNLPAKMYQNKGIVLPAGKYITLKVILGAGEGQNWWCVAYPNQCLTIEIIIPVDLDADEIQLKFKLLEWFKTDRKKYFEIYQDTLMF